MKKHTIILTIGILISKVFGILRETVLSSNYGVSMYADIYKLANDIPIVIYGFIAAGIVTTFIPIYSKIRQNQDEASANKYLSNILNIMGIVSIFLCIFGFIFAEEVLMVFANGYKGEAAQTAAMFLRISIFSILFLSTKSLLEGFLQIKQRFLTTVVSGITLNVVMISTIIISGILKKPILMAYGILIATATQTVIIILISIRTGYRHQKTIAPMNSNFIDTLKMAGPIIIGSSIDQINKTIDTTIASSLGQGSIATLSYASRVSDSILGIFVTSISSVMYPSLAKQASQGRIDELKTTIRKIMNTVNILIIPASIGLMLLAQPVVNILYSRLDAQAAKTTAVVMAFYTLGTVGYGLRQILVRTFYSLHDSITPVVSGFIAIVINITLNLALSKVLGVAGLALATSISALISVVILYTALRRKIGSLGSKAFIWTTLKIAFSALLMGMAVYLVYHFIGGNTGMVLSIVAGVAVYTVALFFMKIEEADSIFNIVLKKLGLNK